MATTLIPTILADAQRTHAVVPAHRISGTSCDHDRPRFGQLVERLSRSDPGRATIGPRRGFAAELKGTKGLVRRKFAGPSGGVTEQIVDVLRERNWTAGHKAQRYLDLGLRSRNEQLNLRLGGDLDPVQRIPRS